MSSLYQTSEQFEHRHKDNIWLLRGIMLTSVLFIASPIAFYKSAGKNVGAVGFGMGIVLSLGQLIAAENSRKTEKLAGAYAEGVMKATAETIASQINVSGITNLVSSKEALVKLIENLPEWKQQRYIAELQLQGLTTPTTAQLLNSDSPDQAMQTIDIPMKAAQPVQNIEDQIDTSWLKKHSFFFGSSIILGSEGSGKTDLIAYMVANILTIAPDTDIKVYDIHYDPENKRRIPNMPLALESEIYLTDPKECYRDMMRVKATLAKRELEKDKTGCPIVRITDEFMGLKDYLGKDWVEFLDSVIQVKTRGRKYSRMHSNGQDLGVRMIIGTHSLKKGETGLSDTFYQGSNFIGLGESINSSSTMFPSNFDVSDLVKQVKSVRAMLIEDGLMDANNPKLDKVRPAVVKLIDQDPTVLIIPKFDLTKYHFTMSEGIEDEGDDGDRSSENQPISADHHPGSDWLEQITSWILSLEKTPTDQELGAAFHQITNKDLDVETSFKLRQMINKKFL